MNGPNDDIFTELWIGVKEYGNKSLFYDTDNEKVESWKSKISSSEDLTEKGNLLRSIDNLIDNKTVRR
jgi:hypothetical protein